MTVLFVDDQEIIREGIFNMFRKIEPGVHIEAVSTGKEGKQRAKDNDYDIIMLDVHLKDISGMEVLRYIKTIKPAAKVVMISMDNSIILVKRAIELGASGYFTKDVEYPEFASGINLVLKGKKYFTADINCQLLANNMETEHDKLYNDLNENQKNIYQHVVDGKDNQEIADILIKDKRNIANEVNHIISRMQCKTRTELVKKHMINIEQNKSKSKPE